MMKGNSSRWSLITAALAVVTLAGFFGATRPGSPLVRAEVASPPIKYRAPATGPAEAFSWRRLAWRGPDGRIDPNGYRRAVAQRLALSASPSTRDGGPALTWTFRGPDNVGGRTRSLLVDPSNPSVLFAGSVGGGVWRSTNAGQTWTSVSDAWECLAIGSLAATPGNFNILYAGTGEGQFNGDALGGIGIYKSKDRGLTWTLLPETRRFNTVNRIAVSPTNPNLILASTRYGGLERSTDGGTTWTNVRWAQGSYDVQFHPADGTQAIAQLIDYDNGWFHTIVRTTDGGVTWTEATGMGRLYDFNSRIDLAYAPSSPNIIYATTGQNGGEIWRSTDGGASFQLRTATSTRSGANWYNCPIWVSPTDPNLVVVGGMHVYRSTDGGQSMLRISDGYILTTQAHPDIHDFVAHPGYNGTTNRQLYVVTDGGVFRTPDITTTRMSNSTWVSLNQGYNTSQFYGAAGHGATGKVIGGTQDNGTLKTETASNAAVLTYGGDGGWSAIDWVDPNFTYGEYVYLLLHRSTNGGEWASGITEGLADAGNSANFIAPFILDVNAPQRLWAGANRLWRTDDARATTPTWTVTTGNHPDNISAIAVRPGNSNVVWYACNDGRIYRTANALAASPTWTAVDNNGAANPLPNVYVTRIVFDPSNPNRVYVCLGGWSASNIRVTTNNGVSWADVTGNATAGLPEAPVRGLAVHPDNPSVLFAGTEVGLFQSADGGTTWSTSTGVPNVSVDEVNWMSGTRTLLLATHGRGMWTAAVNLVAGPVSGQITLQNFGPSPATVPVTLQLRRTSDDAVVATKTATLSATGTFTTDFVVAPGTYHLVAKASHWLSARRASLVLGSGTTTGVNLSLKNGDVDGDNQVTVFDYDALSAAFDRSVGQSGYSANADLDGDGTVTVFDYDILSANFDQSGG